MHASARVWLAGSLRVVLVALGLLAAGVMTTTTTAYAHDSLIDSTPQDGAALQEAPSEIELVFSGNIGTDFPQISVMGADGTDHADGEPVIEGDTLTQPVSGVAEGEYEVGFRIVSSDGHPVKDTLTFSVESAAGGGGDEPSDATEQAQPDTAEPEQTEEPDAAETQDTTPAAGSAASDADGQSSMPWVIGTLVAVLVVVGIVGLLIRRKRRSESSSSPGSQGSPDNTA